MFEKYEPEYRSLIEYTNQKWDELNEDSQNEFVHELDYDYMYDKHPGLGDDGIIQAMEGGMYDDDIAEFAKVVWDTLSEETEAFESLCIDLAKKEADILNNLSTTARLKFGDNAVEALVGVLSTVTNQDQLAVLLENWGTLPDRKINE